MWKACNNLDCIIEELRDMGDIVFWCPSPLKKTQNKLKQTPLAKKNV